MRVMMLGSPRRIVLGTVVAERVLDALALASIFVFVVAARGLSFGPLAVHRRRSAWSGRRSPSRVAVARRAAATGDLLAAAREWLRPAICVDARSLIGAPRARASSCVSLVVWLVEASVYLTVGSATGGVVSVSSGALYVVALTNLSALVPRRTRLCRARFDAAVLLALGSRRISRRLGYLAACCRFVLFVPITVAGLALLARPDSLAASMTAVARARPLDAARRRLRVALGGSRRAHRALRPDALPAHAAAARRLLDRRGAVGRHRAPSAGRRSRTLLRQDGSPPGVLPAAARLDRRVRRRRARDARAVARVRRSPASRSRTRPAASSSTA